MRKSAIQSLLKPESVVLYGASDKHDGLGAVVLRNLHTAGFAGAITLINPRLTEIDGAKVFPDLRSAGVSPDLAIIVTPPSTVPDIIDDCGQAGVRAAIVISAGFRETGDAGALLERTVLRRARKYGLRILGPNCLGVIRTDIGFNGTFSAGQAERGRIAVVSQSGALCTAILDWAGVNDVGFSSLVSTGIGADVEFGEILDFLVLDSQTDSIMLYVEGIRDARRFVSALRAAARVKPVVVMKAGRHAEGSRAAKSHTGALVGADDVFDAALRRAGVLRVADFPDFFAAAAVLDTGIRTRGNRLAIVTNAGGPGVMAADHAGDGGMALAQLAPATVAALNEALPATWSHGNPVDVLGDATPARYEAALTACLADPGVDAVLAILTPQALTEPLAVAERIAALGGKRQKPLLACWMGDASVASARAIFRSNNIPSYRTPEAAVNAFAAVVAYHRNQQQLLQVPEPMVNQPTPALENAELILEGVLAQHRSLLDIAESKALLAAFDIPIVRSIPAATPHDAVLVAQESGFPVAIKIDSPDITHKSDVGGVRLGLTNAREVRDACQQMIEGVQTAMPAARIEGVTVERMWQGRHARELMIGVIKDPVFGPVISFGLGGTMVEVIGDRAVALPPLNRFLARELISRTRADKALNALRGAPAVDRRAVENLLLRVSDMVCELPEIEEMDLNPVLANEAGAVVVDARVAIAHSPPAHRRYSHMAIHPYPADLVRLDELADGTPITIRPIRPEDALIERDFVHALSAQSRYLRFMYALDELTPQMLSRFTQIDYDREMALIVTVEHQGSEVEIGVARYTTLPDETSCEFAIVISDDWTGKGLANKLLSALIDAARARRLETMTGVVLSENQRMLTLARRLGFDIQVDTESPELMNLTLTL